MFDLEKAVKYNKSQGDSGKLKNIPFHDIPYDSEQFAYIIYAFQCSMIGILTPDGMCGPKTIAAFGDNEKNKQSHDYPISGKGFFVWIGNQAIGEYSGKQDLEDKIKMWADELMGGDIRHILIKVADGRTATEKNKPFFEPMLKYFPERKIDIVPWVFSYCYEPGKESSVEKEAEFHAEYPRLFNSRAIVVNAEKGFKDKRDGKLYPTNKQQAETYMMRLKSKTSCTIYLSSYCFVKGHGNFAWKEMCGCADVLCPQSYWSVKGYKSSVECAKRSETEYATYASNKIIVPSGGSYKEKIKGVWRDDYHTPEQITKFLEYLKSTNAPHATFWYWTKIDDSSINAYLTKSRWEAIKNFHW